MKALFLIDTPSQVYNVSDAISSYGIERYDVMINDCNRADTYEQLKNTMVSLSPQEVIEIPRETGDIEKRIEVYAKHLNTLRKANYSHIFFSAIRQQWQRDIVCSLECQNTILMDDGNATVIFYEYLFKDRRFFDFPIDENEERRTRAEQCRQEYGISTHQPTSLSLFTIFDLAPLPWLSVRHNSLNHLSEVDKDVDESSVYILGVGAETVGYIDLEDYVQLIVTTARLFEGKSITYVPHRIESAALQAAILEQGIKVSRFDKPIENQLASMECIPGSIVSYHTTALFTCAKMFPNANIYCARPPMSVWNKAKHSHVWNFTACNNYEGLSVVYKYLEKEPSITTIDLTLN
ncbi:hypothetical protein GTQ48_03915 [Alteromonas genovensis]|uniref:Lipopolysaccharide heptosyltransferase family protein n=1 Tax=Alteromonas genovensis TaxID=471225 RepID=A0A6N9TGL1_9ALTE|nr:hypothetical protein [Alteromonas genovensis]NDW14679.1 hypothetical protein [Alteromonas genovensis]